ncbi:MAG: hypothetical protein ACFFFT_15410 [Candidatus Thorarchaeota archaeon]
MFNLKEFQNDLVLEPLVYKLNKFLSKEKSQKIIKVIEELVILLDQSEHTVPITYILSILAEHDINFITEKIIQKIIPFIDSEDDKLRVNSLIIIGFVLLSNKDLVKQYFNKFGELLKDQSDDIRDNIHFFLNELVKKNPNLVNNIKNEIIESLSIEQIKENLVSSINLLTYCKDLSFNQLYHLRDISKSLILSYFDDTKSKIVVNLLKIISQFYPDFNGNNLETLKIDDLLTLLDNQFLMKKTNFTKLSTHSNITLKEYIKKIKNSELRDEKLFFYTKPEKNLIFIYELERNKVIAFFEEGLKISKEKIQENFSQILKDEKELKIFIETMINLGIIKGFYSNLGLFYSYNHIKSTLGNDLIQKGNINIKKYNYLPPQFIGNIIKEIKESQKDKLLLGKDKSIYYSLKKIQKQINREAAKNSIVDLTSYRERLSDEDFILLIKNLPEGYLSNYHKGTQWLTNLGILKISNEIKSSKIFGFFDIIKNSKKLNIGQILLIDVFDQTVDQRSGIWDKRKEVFYYSKYLTEKIESISSILDEEEKTKQIDLLAKELNIDRNLILTKIDENLQLIAGEIRKMDQIKASDYLEKTGMDLDSFMKFIDELGITYFKKEDLLIFNPLKIEEAKNEIKYLLLDKSKSEDYLSLGNLNIKSNLIEDLIQDLLEDGKLKGIFYEHEGQIQFYTERGIRNLMLENSFIFSFNDLFYGKELNEKEILLLREILDGLSKKRKLKGTFNEETLTFSSSEILFAKDYNTALFEFEKNVNNYIQIFESEFEKIKKILTKENETIFPQEIKSIQEIIDKINEKYVRWRNGLDAFVRKANKKFLKEQGVSPKKYREVFSSPEKKEIKSFAEDPDVFDHLNNFDSWVKLFNKLEVKYPNVIFYQKRLINNPEDKESKNKLMDLMNELYLK